MSGNSMQDWGLYFHIPFCEHRCNYCDFFTTASSDKDKILKYLSYLTRECDLFTEKNKDEEITIQSVYFGGGTPSYVPADALTGILSKLRQECRFSDTIEITVEINPKSALEETLDCYVESGVNRISLGVQSLQPDELDSIERMHSAHECFESAEKTHEAKIVNLNVDLMFGLPGQTNKTWEESLYGILKMRPVHISLYSLMLERNTKMTQMVEHGDISLPDDNSSTDMYMTAVTILNENNFEQYEVSSFALSGYVSKHNSRYWSRKPYKGFGMSAHSYLHPVRSWNTCNYEHYFHTIDNGIFPVAGFEKLTMLQQANEAIMLGLRMNQGLDFECFRSRFGSRYSDLLSDKINGLLEDDPGSIYSIIHNKTLKLTTSGLLVSDSIISQLLFSENLKTQPQSDPAA
jgi:oxygen-independent coproporphyrinogen-3 oxidase